MGTVTDKAAFEDGRILLYVLGQACGPKSRRQRRLPFRLSTSTATMEHALRFKEALNSKNILH